MHWVIFRLLFIKFYDLFSDYLGATIIGVHVIGETRSNSRQTSGVTSFVRWVIVAQIWGIRNSPDIFFSESWGVNLINYCFNNTLYLFNRLQKRSRFYMYWCGLGVRFCGSGQPSGVFIYFWNLPPRLNIRKSPNSSQCTGKKNSWRYSFLVTLSSICESWLEDCWDNR